MVNDNLSLTLRHLGIRTWRGAAMLGLQMLAVLFPVLVGIKLIGDLLGIAVIADQPWWWVLLSAAAPSFCIFVAMAVITEVRKLSNK